MIRKTFAGVLGVALAGMAALAPAQGPEWGGVDDVPTWQGGDTWPMRRTFRIEVDTRIEALTNVFIRIQAGLNFTDNFTLQVNPSTPTGVRTPSIGGYSDTVYLRNRTAGSIVVTGTGSITSGTPGLFVGEEIRLSLNVPATSSMAAGSENWIGVSDLSQVRERFVSPAATGTMTATGYVNNVLNNGNSLCTLVGVLGISCGGSPVAFGLGVDIAIDHWTQASWYTRSGLELIDFPTIDPLVENPDPNPGAERWTAIGQRGIGGSITLQVPALGLDENLELSGITTPLNYKLELQQKGIADPNNRYSDNVFIKGLTSTNADLIYYSPTAKEMSYWRVGDLSVVTPDLSINLKNFITQIINPAGVVLGGNADITNLVINPPRPSFGQEFEVSGNAGSTSGTLITATLLRPLGMSTVSTTETLAGGAFTVRLTAPIGGDNTYPDAGSHEPEYGSLGIQLVRSGSTPPYNRKMVTVRLEEPLAAKDWIEYE